MKQTISYAIIDLETTGGSPKVERITDVAIYRFDGYEVTDKLVSLVNPERPIQRFVQRLTGITDDMVKRAPKFHELAKRIVEITEGCIIVAHNADFDYRVLRNEFRNLGYQFNRNTLCTVSLSQNLIPDLKSYSLGKLCKSLGIPVANRHRADGDAHATLILFKLLLEKDVDKSIIAGQLKHFETVIKKEKIVGTVQAMPQSAGVFYIHQTDGKVIYIGKGKNIKNTLSQVLSRKTKKAEHIIAKMSYVSYDMTGSFVLARLVFNEKLDILKPKYNNHYQKVKKRAVFDDPNLLLIDEARDVNGKSVVLVKDNTIKGYTYIELDYQLSKPDVLERHLTPLSDSNDNREIIKSCIDNNRFKKVIKL